MNINMNSKQYIAATRQTDTAVKADTIKWIAGHFESMTAKMAAAADCTPELLEKAEARRVAFLAHADSKPAAFYSDKAAPTAIRELAKDYTGP